MNNKVNKRSKKKDHQISFFQSLKGKLVLAFIATSVLPVFLLGAFVLIRTRQMTIDSTKANYELLASSQAVAIDTWLENRKDEIVILSRTQNVLSMDKDSIASILEELKESKDFYVNILVANSDGDIVYDFLDSTNNLKEQPSFQDVIQGNIRISDPKIVPELNKLVIAVAAPIYNGAEVIGLVSGRILIDDIANLFKSSWIGETGDGYLISQDGKLFTPSRFTEEYIAEGLVENTTVLELSIDTYASQQLQKTNSGSGFYDNDRGEQVFGVFTKSADKGWGIVIERDEAELFAELNSTIQLSLAAGAVYLIIMVIVVSLLVKQMIVRPISLLEKIAEKIASVDMQTLVTEINYMAKGDLTRSLSITAETTPVKTDDEIGRTIFAFNNIIKRMQDTGVAFGEMTANLQEMVSQVTENAVSVKDASNQLSIASDQSGEAATQISTVIQQVATGNMQQTESITSTANQIDQLGRAIDGVAQGAQEQASGIATASELTTRISFSAQVVSNNAKSGAENAENTANTARSGSETVEQALAAMDAIKQKVGLSVEKVMLMGERSEEIGQILGTITDIASQTNMLALNAAIEAARAGEHGKGFAVVADEVRRLAERSAEATDEIAKLIEEVQIAVEESVTAMNESATEVETGAATVNEAGSALQEIIGAVEEVNTQVQQIHNASTEMETFTNDLVSSMDTVSAVVEENTAAAEEMSASATEVTRAVEDISSISEENSAAVEEVSASTEEMSAQVEEVAATADELSNMAQQLTFLISQFKLDQSQDLAANIDGLKEIHKDWVQKLDDVLSGSLKLEPANIDDHHNCVLGKWYYGLAAMECQEMTSYQQLESPHQKLHEYVIESVKAYNQGDETRSRKLAAQVSGYVDQVLSLLDAFKEEYKRK